MYIQNSQETTNYSPLDIQNPGCIHLKYHKNETAAERCSFYFFYDKTNPANWYIRLSTSIANQASFYYPIVEPNESSIPVNDFLNTLWNDLNVRPNQPGTKTLMHFILNKILVQSFFNNRWNANLSVLLELEQSNHKILAFENPLVHNRKIYELFDLLAHEIDRVQTEQQREKIIRMLRVLFEAYENENYFLELLKNEDYVINGEYQWEAICNYLAFNYNHDENVANEILTQELVDLIKQRDQTNQLSAYWYTIVKGEMDFQNTMLNILHVVIIVGFLLSFLIMLLVDIIIADVLISLIVYLAASVSLVGYGYLIDLYSSNDLDHYFYDGSKKAEANEAKETYKESDPHTNHQGMNIIQEVCDLFEANYSKANALSYNL